GGGGGLEEVLRAGHGLPRRHRLRRRRLADRPQAPASAPRRGGFGGSHRHDRRRRGAGHPRPIEGGAMTATEEPTLYDVLEVAPEASLDELRAAVERARETYGPDSIAVYALVGEGQLDDVRAKLDEAAAVLLDPARRASYDRSIGRPGTSTLWAE